MLDPQHLRSFQEIARTGSYSAAARGLGYTQPALSYQMRLLEKAVGAPLTVRAGRTVRLTPAGQALLRHADQILTAMRVAERDVAHVVRSHAGALRIVTFDSAGATLVPTALADVGALHPAIDVRIVHADPDDATAMVIRGEADVAITFRYDAGHVESGRAEPGHVETGRTTQGGESTGRRSPLTRLPLLTDRVHLVISRRHRLATTRIANLSQLADDTWLVGSPLFADLLRRSAARAGFAVHTTQVGADHVAMQALAAEGVGIALVPGLALLAHTHDEVVAMPLDRIVDGWPSRFVEVELWPDLLRVPAVGETVGALGAAASAAIRSAPGTGGLVAPHPAGEPPDRATATSGDSDRTAADASDWRGLFHVAGWSHPIAARDRPARAVVLSDESGSAQVHGVERGRAAIRLTDHPGGIDLATISPDGTAVWWFADTDGDERGTWMIQPFGDATAAPHASHVDPGHGDGQPTVEARRAASSLALGFASGIAIGAHRAVIGLSDATRSDIYVVERPGTADAPAPAILYSHPQFAAVGALSADDRLVAISHGEHGDTQKPAIRVFRIDGDDSNTAVADLWDGAGFGVWPVSFSPLAGSSDLLVTHERHGRTQPAIWNPVSGEQREVDPQLPGDTAASWFPDASSLLVVHHYRARSELYRVDVATGDRERLATPHGYIAGATPLLDGSVDYLWSNAQSPPRLLNTTGDQPRWPHATGAAPRLTSRPVPLTDVTVSGSAGDAHVLVARPDGTQGRPQPTVLLIHGGPGTHDADSFSAVRSAWTACGYTAVHVNYRGSTGYGAEWHNANIGRPGHAELEDIVAARDALVADGTADPDRIVLAGESWGGYLTLLALGLYPSLWSVGVALVPVADTAAVYDDMMEEIRAAYRTRFGGSPTDVPDVYRESSPLSVIGDVSVPVLITGALRDARCPIRQVELYVERLVELGKQHEFHTFDRGHLPRRRTDRVDEMSKVLTFVRRHLA